MREIISIVLFFTFVSCGLDPNRHVSITYKKDDGFRVVDGFSKDDNVVAWANYTNDQQENGWMYLEITTNEIFPDHIQASAAGFAEGFLTRNIIQRYYKGIQNYLILLIFIFNFRIYFI